MQSESLELATSGNFPGVEFSPLELRLPENLPEQEWVSIGQRLLRYERISQWWIGDWAAFGERKYGALKEFCELNGYNYGTVRNKSWVSGSIHLTLRRDNIEPAFFQEISPFKPVDQKKWLKRIESEKLSVGDLRAQIRLSKGEANAAVSDGPKMGFIERGLDEFISWWRGRPTEFWTPERKAYWRQALKPIVEIWEGLS